MLNFPKKHIFRQRFWVYLYLFIRIFMLSLLLIFGLNLHLHSNSIEEKPPVEIIINEAYVKYRDHRGVFDDYYFLVTELTIINNTNKTIKFPIHSLLPILNKGNVVPKRTDVHYDDYEAVLIIYRKIPKNESILIGKIFSDIDRYIFKEGEKYYLQYVLDLNFIKRKHEKKLKKLLKVDEIYSNIIEFEYSPVVEEW